MNNNCCICGMDLDNEEDLIDFNEQSASIAVNRIRAAHGSSEQTIREQCALKADEFADYIESLASDAKINGVELSRRIAAAIRSGK